MFRAKAWKACCSAVLVATLAGCMTVPDVRRDFSLSQDEIKSNMRRTSALVKPKSGAVERVAYAKIVGKEFSVDAHAKLPGWLDDPITYVTYSQTLEGVARELSERLSVPVRLMPTLLKGAYSSSGDAQGEGELSPSHRTFPVEWRVGSIKGLLDHVSLRADVFWRYRNGGIEFFDTETRTFQIALPPGSRTMSSSISLGATGGGGAGSSSGSSGGASSSSGSSSSSGGSGGASSSVSSNLTIETFAAALSSIKSIVTSAEGNKGGQPSAPNSAALNGSGSTITGAVGGSATSTTGSNLSGGAVTGNAELGMVTVTARPTTLERVEKFIETLNERFAQNVLIQVRVMSVSTNNGFNAGIAMNLLSDNAAKNRLGITGSLLAPTSGSTPGMFHFTRLTGSRTGSEIVASLLSEVGDVSLLRSGQVIAINGQPSGMQVADEINYLASASTTATPDVGSQTSLSPSSRTIGFTASFLPIVMGDNRILLQYTLNLSSLLSMNQISSGGQTIQTPQIAQQSLQQQAYVNDGETLVLFGFEQDRNASSDSSGMLFIAGNRDKNRQMIVIVMDVTRVKKHAVVN